MSLRTIAERLRKAALAYPDAVEEFPWGDRVAKVRGKIFVFLGQGERELHFTAKLPRSHQAALSFPFASPTGYGLGKAGWVSAQFLSERDVPVDMLLEWLDESYRAIAPKTLVKQLDA